MLDMGFRPDVDKIVKQTPRDRQTLLFSATLEGEVRRIADAYTIRRASTHTCRRARPRGSSTDSSASRMRASSTPWSRSCATSAASP